MHATRRSVAPSQASSVGASQLKRCRGQYVFFRRCLWDAARNQNLESCVHKQAEEAEMVLEHQDGSYSKKN